MLTAESEGGQRKCHPYWIPGDYGSFKIKCLSERRASLESPKRTSSNGFVSSSQDIGTKRPGMDRRRSTHNSSIGKKDFPREQSPASFLDSEVPYVIIRKLALTLTTHPFEHMREITQLQYSSWPDFGAPTDPTHVLGLVEHCGAVIRNYDQAKGSSFGAANAPARNGERPIVVHCSAGCGRTGTFCTIDSVIDMLKQQRLNDFKVGSDDEKIDISMKMDVDSEGAGDEIRDWISRDDVDLVAHTVAAFRLQRLSMVQTLRQFVLCYESVLEWLSREIAEGKVAGSAKKAFRA